MEFILIFIIIGFIALVYNQYKQNAEAQAQEQAQREILRNEFQSQLNSLPKRELAIDSSGMRKRLTFGNYSITTTRLRKNAKLTNLQDFVAIDVETSGLSPQSSEIISVAAVRFLSLEPVEAVFTYIKPSKSIPSEATDINGITDETVANSPKFEHIRDSLSEFIGDYNIVAHNIMFDLRFLRHQGIDLDNPKRKYFDTLELSRLYDKDAGNHKLITACRFNGIMLDDDAHDARADALACGLLFAKYVSDKIQPFEQ